MFPTLLPSSGLTRHRAHCCPPAATRALTHSFVPHAALEQLRELAAVLFQRESTEVPAEALTKPDRHANRSKLFESARVLISQIEIEMQAAAAPLPPMRVDDLHKAVCELCRSPEKDDQIILCDHCNRGYHLACLSPPIDAVPEDNWYCSPSCSSGTPTAPHHPSTLCAGGCSLHVLEEGTRQTNVAAA